MSSEVCRSLNVIFPPMAEAALEALVQARKVYPDLQIFETYRSPARQEYLYAQGRTRPGKKVTDAKAMESWHNYGCALDVALLQDGQWSWSFDPSMIAVYFTRAGLQWGGPLDPPHFQAPRVLPLAAAKALVRADGILKYWLELESRGGLAIVHEP